MPSETKIQFCHFDMYTNLFTSLRKLNWNECGTFQVWMDIRGFLDQVSYLNFSFCSLSNVDYKIYFSVTRHNYAYFIYFLTE